MFNALSFLIFMYVQGKVLVFIDIPKSKPATGLLNSVTKSERACLKVTQEKVYK